jgi:hypothetical protein
MMGESRDLKELAWMGCSCSYQLNAKLERNKYLDSLSWANSCGKHKAGLETYT